MHNDWKLLALPADVTSSSEALTHICVAYCVNHRESAMDFAMDLISIKTEATNKMMQWVPIKHQAEAAHLIMESTKEYERIKQDLCMELVARGYELAPLELECIHSTIIRSIFSKYIPQFPTTFPLPRKILLTGVN